MEKELNKQINKYIICEALEISAMEKIMGDKEVARVGGFCRFIYNGQCISYMLLNNKLS